MAAEPDDLEQRFPEPLEFFEQDFIHPDNEALMEREQQRWRLLGFLERLSLQRYASRLRGELQRAGYNDLLAERARVWEIFKAARAEYAATTFINDDAKRSAKRRLVALAKEGKQLHAEIEELHETYELFLHYQGWLDYEQEHRQELKIEAAREKRDRKRMGKESRWLGTLMRDVFKKTNGCHYTYKDDHGREITRTPKFERCVITADAHWFYLSASKQTFLGWRWQLPQGVTISRLVDEEVLQNLRAATKRQVDVIWSETNQLIFRVSRLDSPDALPKRVMWRQAMNFYPQEQNDQFPYTIGINDRRKFEWFDFASEPHILIAGKSQSGKSNLVNGIIATLVSTHTPDELRLVLIDQKGGIEFTHWKELPHLLWEMVKTVDEVQPVLKRLVSVMRHRMARLEAVKAKDVAAYNQKTDKENRMESIWVVFDELNSFVGLGALTEEIHNLIMLLVSQGRAVGVHLIACTQHPEVKVIPGRIKTNMGVRASGAMPTVMSSQIILDSPEAARIANIPGRFAVVRGLKTYIVQCGYILDEDIAGVVSSARRAYPDVRGDLRDLANQPALTIWNEQRVLKAAIEWMEGHLSGQKLHKLLGDESPGERALAKVCREIIDQAASIGTVTFIENNTQWTVEKVKRGYYLRSKSVKPDKEEIVVEQPVTSDKASGKRIRVDRRISAGMVHSARRSNHNLYPQA